jgi:transposase
LKKLTIDERALLNLLSRWRAEAEKKGHRITRIAVAFEAGHDGFWLTRWLAAQGVETHVIHSSSVAVTREHRRAKTDRLDTELLKRGFLGWLRGERGHCKMVAVPTLAEEDAKRPSAGARGARCRGEPDYHSGQGNVVVPSYGFAPVRLCVMGSR